MDRRVLVAVLTAMMVGVLAAPAMAAGTRPQVSFDRISATASGATFEARANSGGETVIQYEFKYCVVSECPAGMVSTPRGEMTGQVDEGDPLLPFSEQVTGLRPDTEYRVTLRVGNDTYWLDSQTNPPAEVTKTFRTAPVTAVVATQAATDPASGISASAATLNGAVVPGNGGSAATPASAWFEWGEAGKALDQSTPAQSIPAGGSATPVAAQLTGLAANKRYAFRIVAERAGSRATGATLEFVTTQVSCPAGSSYQTAVAGRVQLAGCLRAAGQRWVADGEVLLNGLKLTPVAGKTGTTDHRFSTCTDAACRALQAHLATAGHHLFLDRAGRAIGTAGEWNLGTNQLARLYRGSLNLTQLDFDGDEPLMELGADRGVELFDLPLAGKFSFTPKAGGGGALGMLVGIPIAAGGITGETVAGVTPGGDLQLDGLDIEVGEVNLGVFALEELAFRYDRASDLWRGAARFTLPTQAKVTVAVAVTIAGGRFNELSGEVDNLNRHIAKGIFLQRIGVLVGVDPLRVGGSLGLSAGPKVMGVRALGLDGGFLYKDAWSERKAHPLGFDYVVSYPGSLTVDGSFSVVEIPLAKATASFYFTHYPWLEFSGTAGYAIRSGSTTIAGLNGGLDGSIFTDTFQASGYVNATVLDYNVASAYALVNTKGVSACGGVLDNTFALGAYQRWGGSNGYFWACSMDVLKAKLAARAAQGGGGAVKLDGDPQGMIRLLGEGAPPEVRLTGAGGRSVGMPPEGQNVAGVAGSHLVVRDPSTDSTYVLLDHPGKGAWHYEVQPGSAAVRGVQTAGSLPKPRVRATVRRRGSKAQLRWRLRAIRGQRVTFTEEGEGVPPRVIARTNRARGKRTYRPLALLARTRTIVATIEQTGRARDRRVVATFTAPKPRKVTKPGRLRARRRGSTVTVTWKRVAGATRYDLILAGRDGSRELERTRRPRLRLRGAAARDLRSVQVRAVGINGKPGRPAGARPALSATRGG